MDHLNDRYEGVKLTQVFLRRTLAQSAELEHFSISLDHIRTS